MTYITTRRIDAILALRALKCGKKYTDSKSEENACFSVNSKFLRKVSGFGVSGWLVANVGGAEGQR